MSVYQWHGSFLAEWRDEFGKQQRKAFPIEPDARRYEQKMRREVKIKKAAMKRDPASAIGKVGDLCDVWAEAQNYWYNKRVAQDVKVKLGSKRLHELNIFDVKSMMTFWKESSRSGRKLAINTRANFGHTFKRLLKYFETLPGCPREISKQIGRIPAYQPRKEMLTVTEEDSLLRLSEGKPWLNCWLRIFFSLGLRQTEVNSLSPAHYSLEEKCVANVRAKGEINRLLPVPSELQKFFDPLAKKHPGSTVPFIDLLKGVHLTKGNIRWHYNDLKKKAGVPVHKRPHDMRATAITTFYQNNGFDVMTTKKFAGHKYSGSTELYIRGLEDKALAPLMEKSRVMRFDSARVARITAAKKTG